MAPQTHRHDDVALPTIGEQHETDISLEPDVDYKAWKPDRNVKIALAVQTFCVFIISIDMTILTATLPTVARALDATAVESFWIAASYLLASAVCQPTMAALADIFGRQTMFFGSVALFTIGSIVCATAPTVPAMLVGRTIQGVGGGGILSVNLIILSDLVPLLQRPTYQGYIQLVFSLGTFLAPIIGGLLIKTQWRWVFYINLPFCAVGLVAVPIWLRYEERAVPIDRTALPTSMRRSSPETEQQRVMVPGRVLKGSESPSVDWDGSTWNGDVATRTDRPASIDWDGATLNGDVATETDRPALVGTESATLHEDAKTKETSTGDRSSSANLATSTLDDRAVLQKITIGHKLSAVDWTGSLLMITSSTLFLVGLSWGGNKYPWQSPAVLVPIFVGLAGIVFTVMYEKRYAKNPFLRLAIYQHWSGIVVSICTIVQGYLLFAMTYYLVIYLMACKLYSPILAGTGLLPFAVTVVPVSALTGLAITRLGRYRWAIWSGWVVSVLGLGLLILLDVSTHTAAWVVIFMCAGAGQGLLLIGHSVAIQASCRAADAAHAVGMYSYNRSLGLCMGVILGTTVFQNFLRIRLEHVGLPVDIATQFEGFIPLLHMMTDGDPMKLELQQAYAWASKMLFATSCGIGFGGLLLSLMIGDYTLEIAFNPEHRLRK